MSVEKLTPTANPQHVAIIMDGNNRWAKARHLPVIAGHKKGAEVIRHITHYAAHQGIPYLTCYAFSHENWQRDAAWVQDFLTLLTFYLEHEIDKLNHVRLNFIGDFSHFSPKIQRLIQRAVDKTQHQTAITLTIALGYSSRHEIMRACYKMMKDHTADTPLPDLTDYLDTKGLPDPDLLIRTSGEKRLSNFMLWQMAYTELFFTDVLWPDFTVELFEEALTDYRNRERRFGRY